jgi:hypothetical protein
VENIVMKSIKFSALLLLLLPVFVFAGENDIAKVVTGTEKAASCISAVHVNSIDGRQINVPALGFDVEPGTHTMTGRALINLSNCRTTGIGSQRDNVQPLEADFEAGKTYYLGYDHSASNRNNWKLVIWKVEGGEG